MELVYLVGLFLFLLFFLLGLGVWVGLALLGVAWVIMDVFVGRSTGQAMSLVLWSHSTSWTLTALPLFIWMGEILYRTRLSQDMFRGLSPWVARMPGGLLHTNIVGSALFAAISGSSAATLTTVGKMSIPELRKRHYSEKMIVGTLAGAATLGLMIPPSLTLIVYGVTVNESISKLFMAYVAVWSSLNPKEQPKTTKKISFIEKVRASRYLIPLVLLVTVVIGSMYTGLATATEAAAVGVFGALALAALQGSLSSKSFIESTLGAVSTSAMIALILMGASFLSLAMAYTGLPNALAHWINSLQLSPITLLVVLTLFYILIGMFLDGISAVVLTMSVVEPMIRAAGIDIIWFGIFIVVIVEMAQITPPVGFNLFVMQGITQHQMAYIARAAFPMFLIMVFMVVLLVIFPELATYLPNSATKMK